MKTESLSRFARRAAAVGALLAAAGCGDDALPTPKDPASTTNTTAVKTPPPPKSDAKEDAFGGRPALSAPKAFEPKAPTIAKSQSGIALWLVERRTLPLVSVTLSVPRGSAADPDDKPGLAHITANMLDEGAGSLNAVELSSAINDLGATLSLGVTPDGSFVTLTVLKKNFAPAFALFSDVVARPRLEAKEWKRVSNLWKNALEKRPDDPEAVSRVVTIAAHYGPRNPYGHPSDGLLRGAKAIDLAAVKAFYKEAWRPDQATLVIAGDVTQDEAMKAIASGLDGWKPPAPAPAAAAAASSSATAPWRAPRLVLVDRPDAPQSVIAVVREGVTASDPRAPLLDLINTALGGSFTSRLNQNLREDHGWTYGARSAFTESRKQGTFLARAAVHTEVTGAALKETLRELSKMAAEGLTQDEFLKVLAQDRGDLVQAYESVSSISLRLGRLAMLGLPATFDAEASRARQGAALAALKNLATAVDPKTATIVVVGPRTAVVPQLASIGLGEPELWDAEGSPIAGASAPAKPDAPATRTAPINPAVPVKPTN
jgi:zinc protease